MLKTTHDSGTIVICDNKRILDKASAKKQLEESLKRNFYLYSREWPYKNVRPRILAEEYNVELRLFEWYTIITFLKNRGSISYGQNKRKQE